MITTYICHGNGREQFVVSLSMVSIELHSITVVRRTAASVDEMHQQAQVELNP